MRILSEIHKNNNVAILMVTHDNELAKRTDRMLRMQDGEIVQ
jgi:ABC-type lipoprotein export system ATPase subunit